MKAYRVFGTRAIAALLFGLLQSVVCAAAQEMTVDAAIRLGLENNYAIRIARHTAEIAANNRGLGTAGFLPRLEVDGGYRYDTVNDSTGSPLDFGNADTRTWLSEIRLGWTLFDGFRMFADRQRYDELAGAGAYAARDRIETTVVQIMRAFFNLVQQEQLHDVARTNRDISRDRLERETVRRDLGGASSTDLLNARVNFNNDQSLVLDRELAVTVAATDLNIVLARDPATPVAVKKEIELSEMELPLEELLRLALNNNSALLAARFNRQAFQAAVRIARSTFWPRLDMSGSYGYTDRSMFGDHRMPGTRRTSTSINAGVGLVLSYSLFNGNVDRINLHNARLEALNSELALKDITNLVAGSLQERYAAFIKLVEKVSLEEQNFDTALQNLERQKERYATGASGSLDFRDAQVNYAQAQIRLIVARYEARIALLEIQQLAGSIALE